MVPSGDLVSARYLLPLFSGNTDPVVHIMMVVHKSKRRLARGSVDDCLIVFAQQHYHSGAGDRQSRERSFIVVEDQACLRVVVIDFDIDFHLLRFVLRADTQRRTAGRGRSSAAFKCQFALADGVTGAIQFAAELPLPG